MMYLLGSWYGSPQSSFAALSIVVIVVGIVVFVLSMEGRLDDEGSALQPVVRDSVGVEEVGMDAVGKNGGRTGSPCAVAANPGIVRCEKWRFIRL